MTKLPAESTRAVPELEAKYRREEGSFFFTGVQALVRVPIDRLLADRRAGRRTAAFISGYQGSPLGGFDRELLSHAELIEGHGIVHRPGVNEELAATAVMGSQLASTFPKPRYDGVLGVWYGKAPGLDRAGDAIRHAAYAGTHALGGVLALAGDDPANKSSTLPSASEHTLADLHVPTLHPGSVQEVVDLGAHGIALSRSSGLWCALKIVTAVADSSGTVAVGPDRITPICPELEWRGSPYHPYVNPTIYAPTTNAVEQEIHEARIELALRYGEANGLNRITIDTPGAWLGIVASGHCYHDVLEAARVLGLDTDGLRRLGVRVLQLRMLFPFDTATARRFATGLEEILVIEEKRPFIESHLREALYGTPGAPRIVGKRTPDGATLIPGYGALDADALVGPLRDRLVQRVDTSRLAPAPSPPPHVARRIAVVPARTPYFCSGCPHSTGTRAPEGKLVGAGIGCHGLIGVMDPARVGIVTCNTQMGGEGAQWIGIEPFVDVTHFTQNMGDGTFAHSGSLAVRAAVAAGADMTFKILYNGAVAMTGGQDAAGAMAVPRLAQWLLAEGVSRVAITTDDLAKYRGVRLPDGVRVHQRAKIIEVQKDLAAVRGVTVLVHDQQCAAELRRDRKRGRVAEPRERVVINERVCEGCGDCGTKSNCLSVQPIDTEFGRKTRIHQSSCNKDYSCLDGDCPSFLTVVTGTRARRPSKREGGARRRPDFDTSVLPEPVLIVPADDMTIRMPGIGGTGVVTVAQVLGTAAALDGKFSGGLDQTGLSQKAGPVVSDLRITAGPVGAASKLTAGSADLYLVFDILAGSAPTNLAGVSAERTVAVVSTSQTPTGLMVRDPHAEFPDIALLRADLDTCTRPADSRYADTIALAEGLFGESTTANLFQVGIAYQIGAIPIAASAIEQAIELNGAAVEANTLAFRWGRLWAVDPSRVQAASRPADGWCPTTSRAVEEAIERAGLGQGELGGLVRRRAADLAQYQDERYALRYVELVRRAHDARQPAFTEAVVRNLYKLMAYKDEYEVARLHLEQAARLQVEAAVGADARVSYNLQPPLLRSLGLRSKVRLGPWFTPVLKALRASRRLRGTPFDVFGYTAVRRTERSLVKEYAALVETAAQHLSESTAGAAVALASLPDTIRGYEQIKMRSVVTYRAELSRLRRELQI